MSSKELTAFLAWAEENEILWDKAAIEIKETPSKYGLGVFAKKHLEPGYEGTQEEEFIGGDGALSSKKQLARNSALQVEKNITTNGRKYQLKQ